MSNFYIDTIQRDSRFHSTTRVDDPLLLEPVTRAAVAAIIADAKMQGVTLAIGETFRSQARQMMLFAQGATQLQHVGVHNFGLACDLWILIGGEVNWKAPYFKILQPLANKHKLVYGGDWGKPNEPHSFRDYDHVQRIAVADQQKLFSGSWYPDDGYVASGVG